MLRIVLRGGYSIPKIVRLIVEVFRIVWILDLELSICLNTCLIDLFGGDLYIQVVILSSTKAIEFRHHFHKNDNQGSIRVGLIRLAWCCFPHTRFHQINRMLLHPCTCLDFYLVESSRTLRSPVCPSSAFGDLFPAQGFLPSTTWTWRL